MKNGASPKRSNGRTAGLPPEVQGATCLAIPVEAADAPMWPIHAAGWLEPEARAAAPSWTGLIVERRNRVPAPDLIQFPLAPFPRDGAMDAAPEAIFSAAAPTVRQSDLAPLGWDPRAAFPKKESQ
jgi:hypothetical protein